MGVEQPSSSSSSSHSQDQAEKAPQEETPIQRPVAPYFKSRRLVDGEVPENKLWTNSAAGKKAMKRTQLFFAAGLCVGLIGGCISISLSFYDYYRSIHKYCLVLDENFDGPLNRDIWKAEVSVGGYGNAHFDWTTDSDRNSFTKDGKLYIMPTYTADVIGEENLWNGYTVNLTADGTCTQPESLWSTIDTNEPMQVAINSTFTNCIARSNSTLGTIIPPTQSARLTTKGTVGLKYGRVEIVAKLPTGDWLWPAIWMLPVEDNYGTWPASGEIDLVESSGNKVDSRYSHSYNNILSSIHFGYDRHSDDVSMHRRTDRALWRNYYNEEFHTFGIDWSPERIFTWEGSRNRKLVDFKFNKWPIQHAPTIKDEHGVVIAPPNPWINAAHKSAPFDHEFYLILNVAVGGTIGYFSQGPWSNEDPNAAAAFWSAKNQTWGPTWSDDPNIRGMVVDSVKIWQQC